MDHSPRGCVPCSHGISTAGGLSTRGNTSCEGGKRLLRKGPVCLQGTKWTGAEIEHLYQQIPGVRVFHSAAVRCGERTRTGGVAILLPPGGKHLKSLS